MRVGLFGGSFDPVHCGHIEPVRELRDSLPLDRVYFLPTARAPHKPDGSHAPPLARYAMVEIALLGDADLFVSSHELTLGRAAYTVETIEHFHAAAPNDEIVLIVGADSFVELDTWRRWQELLGMVTLAVLVRPGWPIGTERLSAPLRAAVAKADVRFFENRPLAISSTTLRQQLRSGDTPSSEVLPRPVLDFIQKYDLYR